MTEQGKKNIVWGVFATFMVLLVWGSWGYSSYDPARDAKRLAKDDVDYCWAKQRSADVYPSVKLQMAAECQEMEKTYEKMYPAKP